MSKFRLAMILILFLLLALAVGAYAVEPADWESEDIGTAAATPGSTDLDASGLWTIEADGNDIWDSVDGFRFVHQEVSGDFEISCQMLSIQNTNEWAKGGVMARATVDANSAYSFSFVSVSNGTSHQWRTGTGAGAAPDGGGLAGVAPYYVKLVREGDMFSAFRSTTGDADDWEPNNTVGGSNEVQIAMEDPIRVGLALTSHSAGVLCTAEFDSLEATFAPQPVEPAGKLPITWAEIKGIH